MQYTNKYYESINDIKELICDSAEKYNRQTYLVSNEIDALKFTYNDLLKWAENFEYYLEDNNIGKGVSISVIFHNSTLMVLLFLSILFSKRVFVPINPLCSANEIDYILKDSNAKMLIYDENMGNKLTKDANNTTRIKVNVHDEFIQKIFRINKQFITNTQSKNEVPAQVVYTSGTTGDPKGVVLTHRNILADSYGIARTFKFNTTDNFLTVTPLFHNSGQIMSTIGPLWSGGQTTAVRSDFGLINFWHYIDKYKINWSLGMPTHIKYLLQCKKEPKRNQLKGLFCGGAKLEIEYQKEFEKRFKVPLFPNYGLTETTSIASCAIPNDSTKALGSVGKPLMINKIMVITKNGNVAQTHEEGQILIKGENLFKEYLNKPKITKANVIDGWLHSGDLGYLDNNNNLFINERIDNMILVGGENIYPADIERVVPQLKGISEGILGSIPHYILGNELILIYSLKKGCKSNEMIWKSKLEENLSSFKVPKIFIDVKKLGLKSIPKAPNGKVLRSKIRSILYDYYEKATETKKKL